MAEAGRQGYLKWFIKILQEWHPHFKDSSGNSFQNSSSYWVREAVTSTQFYLEDLSARSKQKKVTMSAVMLSRSTRLNVQGHTLEAPMKDTGFSAENITLFVRMMYVKQYLWVVVYKEIGIPLHDLPNLFDVFQALNDATSGEKPLLTC